MLRRLASLLFLAGALQAATLDTGEIAGAGFSVALPARWNRSLLLIAHDERPPGAPLTAGLDPGDPVCRALLDEGWMIAATSYRRNGLVLANAMADLDALRAHIAETYGPPERVLIAGDAMGGTIAILIAERGDGFYSGALAIDPALELREPNGSTGLILQPKIPLIFLCNQTELQGPRDYVTAKILRATKCPQPVVFAVARDGHLNLNDGERLAALRALNTWLDRGPAALPRPAAGSGFFDATVPPQPQPSQVGFAPDGRGFDARVLSIDPAGGNVTLNAQPDDFRRLGLGKNMFFQLTVRGRSYHVRYGRDFTGMKRGRWIALPKADGFLLLGRNLANAAATAGLAVGDTVTIRLYEAAPAPAD